MEGPYLEWRLTGMGALQRTRDGIGGRGVFEGSIEDLPLLRKTLPRREVVPLLDIRTPFTLVPLRFMGLFASDMDPQSMVEEMSERNLDAVVLEQCCDVSESED